MSTEAQAEADRNSLPVQRAEFARFCADRAYIPVAEYTDVESGRNATRREYQRMLTDVRAGSIDVIVVTFLDRFGRDQWEVMARMGELRSLGVEVQAIQEDAREFIAVALSAWKADQESKRIGERVKKTMHYAVAHGVPMGRAPYGYRREGKAFVVAEYESKVIRDIFRWCADENMGSHAITARLNERAIKPPLGGIWFDSAVKRVLSRKTYTGTFVWGNSESESVPRIIEPDLYQRAQEAMQRRKVLPKGNTQRSEFLLSGLLFCGHCDGRMNGSSSRVKRHDSDAYRTYPHYVCSGRRKWQGCNRWNRHDADTLEAAIVSALDGMASSVHEAKFDDETPALRERLTHLDRQRTALQKRLASNLDAFHAQAVTVEQLAIDNDRLAREQADVDRAYTAITEQIAAADRKRQDAAELPSRMIALKEALAGMSKQRAKGLIQQMVESIKVFDDGQPAVITLR